MEPHSIRSSSRGELAELFRDVFTASEGTEEGVLIGNLASDLASEIDNQDIMCFGTYEGELIVAAVFFTRLRFDEPIQVFLLAPMATRTEYQGKGIGSALIKHALQDLKGRSVSIAITYGDPAFYSQVGFQSLSEDVIQAPLDLSYPSGWLGQSLSGRRIPKIHGRPTCVKEFDNPAYW